VADEGRLSITEVTHAAGLPSSALRYYEKAGLITPVGRAGGRRLYDASVLQRLAAIALLQEAGFTIAEAGRVLGAGGRSWRPLAEQKLRELDEHLAQIAAAKELLVSALKCECAGFDTCQLVSARRGRHKRVVQGLSTTPRDDDL
jgi:MerR family transcriptional regulator, redox-sensitive transcriptional activator SoxR